MLEITIHGRPITKKNHQQLIKVGNRMVPIQSKQYKDYEEMAGWYIQAKKKLEIDYPVNVKCVYYMPTKGIVDLVNLIEATNDILVKYHVLKDDNSRIVAGHDGSRVLMDRDDPRVEITITPMEEHHEQESIHHAPDVRNKRWTYLR